MLQAVSVDYCPYNWIGTDVQIIFALSICSHVGKRVDSMDESPNWDFEGLLRRVGTVQVMIFRIIEYRKRTKQSTVLGWQNAKSSALALVSS
jgi:hypothetical protein